MKKLGLLLLTLTLLLSLCGCSYQDPVLATLPDYKTKVFYTSGGFQDFTDYAKYTYESVTAQDLKLSKFFAETTADDVGEILLHIDNFEDWVETIGEELKDNYDFDKNIVSADTEQGFSQLNPDVILTCCGANCSCKLLFPL